QRLPGYHAVLMLPEGILQGFGSPRGPQGLFTEDPGDRFRHVARSLGVLASLVQEPVALAADRLRRCGIELAVEPTPCGTHDRGEGDGRLGIRPGVDRWGA